MSPRKINTEREYYIQRLSLLAIVPATLFGTVYLVIEQNYVLGTIELLVAVLLVSNILILRHFHNWRLSQNIFLVAAYALMGVLVVTGGFYGTGAFWTFTVPMGTFFLQGCRRGRWWMAAFYLELFALGLLAYLGVINIAYQYRAIQQLSLTLLVLSFVAYYYERRRELFVRAIDVKNETLLTRERALESIENGVLITDVRRGGSVILYANKAFLEQSQYRTTNILDKPWTMIFGKETALESIQELVEAMQARKTARVTARICRRDGTSYWGEVSVAPVISKGRATEHYVIVVHDVTVRYEAELEIRTRTQELEAMNKMMVGRELRMIELKKEIERLREKCKEPVSV